MPVATKRGGGLLATLGTRRLCGRSIDGEFQVVPGIDKFREHFAGQEENYALIGGAACSLIFEEVGVGGGTIVVSDPADVHDTTNRERTSEIDAARVKLWILIMGTIPVAIGRVRVEQGRFYGTAKMR